MISIAPFAPGFATLLVPKDGDAVDRQSPTLDDLDHALRRADEEAIAEARSGHPVASERHGEMSSYYSIRALELLERRDANSVPILQLPA